MSHRTAAFIALIGGGVLLMARSAFGGQSGAKLSTDEIARLASNAGFTGNDLSIAVAVALAESGGNPNAHGDLMLPGSGSYGLWQIYSHAHPEYGPNFDQLFDPQTNADAAFAVYSAAGNSFRPWSTFNSGIYANYLSDASGAVNA